MYSQLLNKRYKDKLDKEANEFISFIQASSIKLNQLIDDILDYSRAGSSEQKIESVDLQSIVEEIKLEFTDLITRNQAVISISKLPNINIDRTQISQLFRNLIGNALKYCKDNPLVEIGFKEQQNHWQFYIKDNGIGIKPNDQKKIFELFKRLHAYDQYSGTGLGLAICQRIIKRLNGKIWLESEENKGSTFFFTVPKL